MGQLALFDAVLETKAYPEGYINYVPGLIPVAEGHALMGKLIEGSNWEQRVVKMYDREVLTPRLTTWYGSINDGIYTGETIQGMKPWTPELLDVKAQIEALSGTRFNSVLLNLLPRWQ